MIDFKKIWHSIWSYILTAFLAALLSGGAIYYFAQAASLGELGRLRDTNADLERSQLELKSRIDASLELNRQAKEIIGRSISTIEKVRKLVEIYFPDK